MLGLVLDYEHTQNDDFNLAIQDDDPKGQTLVSFAGECLECQSARIALRLAAVPVKWPFMNVAIEARPGHK